MPPTTVRAVRAIRRVTIAVVGFSVLGVGVAMTVLPGPAMVMIPAGLGILAVEFVWARRLLRRLQDKARALTDRQNPDRTTPD